MPYFNFSIFDAMYTNNEICLFSIENATANQRAPSPAVERYSQSARSSCQLMNSKRAHSSVLEKSMADGRPSQRFLEESWKSWYFRRDSIQKPRRKLHNTSVQVSVDFYVRLTAEYVEIFEEKFFAIAQIIIYNCYRISDTAVSRVSNERWRGPFCHSHPTPIRNLISTTRASQTEISSD